MKEISDFIDINGTNILAVQYLPDNIIGQILMCAPIFEERKASHRTMVETARLLCSFGFHVIRFDYRGCGDSEGEFKDFSADDWIADIVSVFNFMKSTTKNVPIGIIGLRFGTTLLFNSPSVLQEISFAVAWEPVINGKQYLTGELRKKIVKEMIMGSTARSQRNELINMLENGNTIDFDGYPVTPIFYKSISRFTAETFGQNIKPIPVLLTSIYENSSDCTEAKRILCKEGCVVTFMNIRCPPFWNLLGLTDTKQQTEQTAKWILGIEANTHE